MDVPILVATGAVCNIENCSRHDSKIPPEGLRLHDKIICGSVNIRYHCQIISAWKGIEKKGYARYHRWLMLCIYAIFVYTNGNQLTAVRERLNACARCSGALFQKAQ